jgi:hypothetical protein
MAPIGAISIPYVLERIMAPGGGGCPEGFVSACDANESWICALGLP